MKFLSHSGTTATPTTASYSLYQLEYDYSPASITYSNLGCYNCAGSELPYSPLPYFLGEWPSMSMENCVRLAYVSGLPYAAIIQMSCMGGFNLATTTSLGSATSGPTGTCNYSCPNDLGSYCGTSYTGTLGTCAFTLLQVTTAILNPTASPTLPSRYPSKSPSTASPSKSPSTASPSKSPSTKSPSHSPSSSYPSRSPSKSPIRTPTRSPTPSKPSFSPSRSPTRSPKSSYPSRSPSASPASAAPSASPTVVRFF